MELGDLAFREPVAITQDRTIIDGYARLKLAQLKERQALPCIVYELSETEALQSLLQRHLQSSGWNALARGQLAIDLEPGLREKALSNLHLGVLYNCSRGRLSEEGLARNLLLVGRRTAGSSMQGYQALSRADSRG